MSFEDSLSVFNLIDSLLSLEGDGAQLAIRVGYNSNVLSAGRTLGIENFGLSPGVSYYHPLGFYADVSGFWSKDFTPEYYLTTLSVGYMHDFAKWFSIMADYDRYLYAESDLYIPYKNTVSITPVLEFKPITMLINYSFYFGDTHVHRIMPGLSGRIQKKKWAGLDRVSFSPAVYMLLGNEIITEINYPYGPIEERIRQRRGLPWYEQIDRNVFGIMNYTLSAPLSIMYRKWTFTFTYNYNIPKALPGESITYGESSYLSGSLSYFIDLKRNKLSL
ncbi:hypothetical protein DQQ10_18130 [Pseudochryseolinea flava]|uniref:Uncharacterized protein n=2 Tax=Pseudochryseolinea flava TaxID=2059302 RepID=A0A364Y181_9BACT|nr:hypothetical protein DQQ10_18130 [Pseudochryseolinea flava]